MNPGPLTLRELCWMVEGRQRDQWNHTAQVLAMLYNAFRDRRQPARAPADFHPLMFASRPRTTLRQLADLVPGLRPTAEAARAAAPPEESAHA